jgi:hypothetical protein
MDATKVTTRWNSIFSIWFFLFFHDLNIFLLLRFVGVGGFCIVNSLSFDRTIQVIQNNKINTTKILDKYKMLPKCKALINIPFFNVHNLPYYQSHYSEDGKGISFWLLRE